MQIMQFTFEQSRPWTGAETPRAACAIAATLETVSDAGYCYYYYYYYYYYCC